MQHSQTTCSISVVIPTYNRAKLIPTTIDSLLAQTNPDFEIIVVDDGSTDETSVVLKFYADKYRHRLKVIRVTNGERGRARNIGTHAASGSYINFLDSDDIAYPYHVKNAVTAISEFQSPEWFYLACDISGQNGKLPMTLKVSSKTLNDSLLDGNVLGTNGVFVRRDVAIRFPFHEPRELSGSEDYELWLRLAHRFPLRFSPKTTSCLIEHDGRSMNTMSADKIVRRISYLISLVENPNEYGKDIQAHFRVTSYLYAYLAVHLASMKGYKLLSIRYLASSLIRFPSLKAIRRIVIVARDTITVW